MAATSLTRIVDKTFIDRFAALGTKENTGAALARALRGQGSDVNINSKLRVGALTYAKAVQGLNTAISFVNLSDWTLGKLDAATDKMLGFAREAAKATTSTQSRETYDKEFRKGVLEFRTIVNKSQEGGKDYLHKSGLEEIFIIFGLDAEESSSVKEVFDSFSVPEIDDCFASEFAHAPHAQPSDTDFISTFDGSRNIRSRADAAQMFRDLKSIKEQITTNQEALTGARNLLGQNLELARAAGTALLDLSEELRGGEEAEQVAIELRRRIRTNARAALSQVENLQPLAVAAALLNPDSFN